MASDVLVLAKDVLGTTFPTQKALDQYLKEHPGANKSLHRVKKEPGGEKEQAKAKFLQQHPQKIPNVRLPSESYPQFNPGRKSR